MKILGWVAFIVLVIAGLIIGVVSFILFGKSFDIMPEWAKLFITGIVFMIISLNIFFNLIPSLVKDKA